MFSHLWPQHGAQHRECVADCLNIVRVKATWKIAQQVHIIDNFWKPYWLNEHSTEQDTSVRSADASCTTAGSQVGAGDQALLGC